MGYEHNEAIEVLLATYNGESYLREQIDSILGQTHSPTRILARDDGSKDHTAAILQTAAESHPASITVLPANGATGHATWNFQRLMQASNAPYVALADQDDVWLPGKLAESLQAMQRLERQYDRTTPLLVFTDLRIVDTNLKTIASSMWIRQRLDPQRAGSLRLLLTDNVVTGCTILMNRALVERSVKMSNIAVLHDWWIALTACAFGHAYGLNQATIFYRQHSGNVIGAAPVRTRSVVPKLRMHEPRRAQWERSVTIAKAFLEIHGNDLPPAQRAMLQSFALCENNPNRIIRIAIWIRHRLFQKSLRENLAILWYLWDMNSAKRTGASTLVRT